MTAVLPNSLFEMRRGLCPGCGAPLPIETESASTECRHCGMQAVLERRLRKQEPEVPDAPLRLYIDVGGAEIGATGTATPWVRTKQFRESFVERAACPGCGEGMDVSGEWTRLRCDACGTESVVERRLWAPLPDPATEIPRRRRPEERRHETPEDAEPETEHLVWRVLHEEDGLRRLALARKLKENWIYVNKTSARLLPSLLASLAGADPRYQFAVSQLVCKLLCEGDPALRNAAIRAAERFLFDTACPRALVFEVGMGDAVCLKPLLDAAEFALRRGDREYACAALLGVDWMFQRNYDQHAVMGEILLYRMLYLTGPVLAYAIIICQRQRGVGFYYPPETLLRFMDDAAVERPVLLPELDKALYASLPADEAEYRRRRAFYDGLKTDASRASALRGWLWPPQEAPQDLYREIARFLVPRLDDPALRPAAEKALVDLVTTPNAVPEAVHELVAERRDALPAEMRRAYRRFVPDTKLLDFDKIPYWQGEPKVGLSPEIQAALDDWNEGLEAAHAVNVETRDAYKDLDREELEALEAKLSVFDDVETSEERTPEPEDEAEEEEEPQPEWLPTPDPTPFMFTGDPAEFAAKLQDFIKAQQELVAKQMEAARKRGS